MAENGATVAIVGAGVAGLACAQALVAGGRRVKVLERARGVGGRCATRRVEGQPVDFGVTFFHGRDPAFLAALAAVPATRLDGWPLATFGAGRPCQPAAFAPDERRLAFAEGVTAFPKHLAAGVEVQLRTEVAAIEPAGPAVRLRLADGEPVESGAVVLALAAEQTHALLGTIPEPQREVQSARELLAFSRSMPCLTIIAVYPGSSPAPAWDAFYPEDSRILQHVAHDSSKRCRAGLLAMVYQAHAHWSGAHLEDPDWPSAVLREAERLLGGWAALPVASEAHRWKHARNDRSAELASPMLLTLPGGAQLGVCGDRFAPGGGVEAAWKSGRAMAARLLSEVAR
jgi:predicted NAD/FAD-dependent oxidoreductase